MWESSSLLIAYMPVERMGPQYVNSYFQDINHGNDPPSNVLIKSYF